MRKLIGRRFTSEEKAEQKRSLEAVVRRLSAPVSLASYLRSRGWCYAGRALDNGSVCFCFVRGSETLRLTHTECEDEEVLESWRAEAGEIAGVYPERSFRDLQRAIEPQEKEGSE